MTLKKADNFHVFKLDKVTWKVANPLDVFNCILKSVFLTLTLTIFSFIVIVRGGEISYHLSE